MGLGRVEVLKYSIRYFRVIYLLLGIFRYVRYLRVSLVYRVYPMFGFSRIIEQNLIFRVAWYPIIPYHLFIKLNCFMSCIRKMSRFGYSSGPACERSYYRPAISHFQIVFYVLVLPTSSRLFLLWASWSSFCWLRAFFSSTLSHLGKCVGPLSWSLNLAFNINIKELESYYWTEWGKYIAQCSSRGCRLVWWFCVTIKVLQWSGGVGGGGWCAKYVIEEKGPT